MPKQAGRWEYVVWFVLVPRREFGRWQGVVTARGRFGSFVFLKLEF